MSRVCLQAISCEIFHLLRVLQIYTSRAVCDVGAFAPRAYTSDRQQVAAQVGGRMRECIPTRAFSNAYRDACCDLRWHCPGGGGE